MKRIQILCCLLLLIVLNANSVHAQIPTSIPVALPVHGYHTFEADGRLFLLNAFSGDVQILDEMDMPYLDDPNWNVQGDRIAYNKLLDISLISPFESEQPVTTIPNNIQYASFKVQGWSPDGTRLLGTGIDVNSTYYDLQVMNLSDNSLSLLRRDLIDMPLSEDPQLEVYTIRSAAWNPVYEQWVVLEISTFEAGTESYAERPSVTVILLLNHQTGETHVINDFVPDPIEFLGTHPWSPDGQELLLETQLVGTRVQVVSVLDGTGAWQFQLGASADDTGRNTQNTISWIGVDDLFLINERDRDTTEQIYSIAQVTQNELHVTEVFRIPILSFSTTLSPSIGRGDWHLTADEAERHQLSCLFDQAMPTRIGVGQRARVNFTDGTPLRLRSEPSLAAPEITQMPEGTEFDIIGGSACVNDTDYYRFWQIELDDGTIGWAAEAGMSDYFIEPVSAIAL